MGNLITEERNTFKNKRNFGDAGDFKNFHLIRPINQISC